MQPPVNAPYFRPVFETGRYGLKCPACGTVIEGTPKTALSKMQKHWTTHA